MSPWATAAWPVRPRDLALAAACLTLAVSGTAESATTPGPRPVLLACIGLGCALLPWRRLRPTATWALTTGPLTVYWLVFGAPENGGMLVVLIAMLYAVGRWEPVRRQALLVLLLMVPVMAVHEWRDPTNTSWHLLLLALPYDAVGLCAWLLGALVRARGEQRVAATAKIAAEERTPGSRGSCTTSSPTGSA